MLTTSKILSFLSKDSSLEIKKLEKALKLTKKIERDKLHIALTGLQKLEIINNDDDGKITLNPESSAIKARIRCSSKGYCFAVREDNQEDIYIRENFLNHAWHGDYVMVNLIKEAQRRRSPEGSVLCILERNTTSLISIIKEQNSVIYADPLDDRLLEEIILPKNDKKYIKEEEIDNIVEVKINKYPIAQYSAEGEVIRKLPLNRGIEGDLDIILAKSNLQINHSAPRVSAKKISGNNRVDLTSQPSLLLKSWTHKDSPTPPAIHVEPIETGTRIWVHTPAISERFTFGGKIDDWLKTRGESICLGYKWRKLLNDEILLSSMFEINKENDAISLYFDIDHVGKVIDWSFQLSKVKPVALIKPEQLENIANRKPKTRAIPQIIKPIKEYISQLQTLLYVSSLLYKKENDDIKLELPIPNISNLSELSIETPGRDYHGWSLPLNPNDPNSILKPILKISNSIWFIHSNNHQIPTISFKSHDLSASDISEVIKSAISMNLEVEIKEDGSININDFLKKINMHKNKHILHKIFKQCLNNKELSINDFSLNKELLLNELFNKVQSPWCNPNYSYIDIVNQSLIVTLLKEGKSKPKSKSDLVVNLGKMNSWNDITWKLFTNTVASNIESLITEEGLMRCKRNISRSDLFRENLISMSKSREAIKLINEELEGSITGVQSYGFFTEISPLAIEGLVHVSTLNDDWYEYRSRQSMLIGRKNKRTYKVGDKVVVKIIKVDLLRNQIDLEIVTTKPEAQNDQVPNSLEVTID